MRKMRMTLAAAVVLIVTGTGVARAGTGDVRFDARLDTPGMSIHIANTPRYRADFQGRRALPERALSRYRIMVIDRQIARRLARYTGYTERRLLRLRRMGYRWTEIGIWLGLPRPAIRAARHADTWQRYLHEERRMARRGRRVKRYIAGRDNRRGRR